MLVHQQTSVLWYIGPFQYTALTSVFMMSPLFLLPPSHHVPPSRHTALPLSLCSDCFIHNHVCSQLRRSAVHLQFVVHVRCIYAAIFRWVHCIGLLFINVFFFLVKLNFRICSTPVLPVSAPLQSDSSWNGSLGKRTARVADYWIPSCR